MPFGYTEYTEKCFLFRVFCMFRGLNFWATFKKGEGPFRHFALRITASFPAQQTDGTLLVAGLAASPTRLNCPQTDTAGSS